LHIPDGYLDPWVAVLFFVLSAVAEVWAWRGLKGRLHGASISTVAVCSSFVFAAQMLNFPIIFGTSGHLVGGTFLAMLLGPQGAVASMSMVILLQAFLLGDGGMTALGANIFNMAVMGGLSFYFFELLGRRFHMNFLAGAFAASWASVMVGGTLAGLEIGVSSVFTPSGGIFVTVPSMAFWHSLIGIGEGAITVALLGQLNRSHPALLLGLRGWKVD